MKKILSMMVGLLTAIALLAVVAAARDDGPAAPAETTAAAGQSAASDRDGVDAGGRDGGAEDGTDAGAPAEGTWEKGEWCEEPDPEAWLQELADAGVIDQDQIPAITQWLKTQGPTLENYDDPSDLLAAAVTDGVITQTQADDIADLITQMKQMESEEGYGPDENGPEGLLQELADAGVINQDQIPAITQWLKTQGPTLENYDDPSDLLAAAVTDGVITQTQADDIADLITQMKQMESEEGCGPDEDGPEGLLKELAAQGVIDQDQIPAIAQWLKTQGPTLENYDDPGDLLASAVADGVITQTQADDISNLINRMEQSEGRPTMPS